VKRDKLTITFKSGATVTIDRVESWEVQQGSDDKLCLLSVAQKKSGLFSCNRRLIVKTVDLASIDAIVEHR